MLKCGNVIFVDFAPGFTIYCYFKKKLISWKNCYVCKKRFWSSALFFSLLTITKDASHLVIDHVEAEHADGVLENKYFCLKKVCEIGGNDIAWFSCRPAVPYLTKLQAAILGKTWHIGLGKESRRWRGS